MELLVREPDAPPAATAPLAADPETVPAAEGRSCETCGAAMAPQQDWCLECGTAAPGRIGARPGWRPAVTVLGLTLLLATGAVAAAYAALSGDANREAAKPAAAADTLIAQAPPATPPAVTTPPVTPTPPVAPTAATTPPAVVPPTTPTAPIPSLPHVTVPTTISPIPNITAPSITIPNSNSNTTPTTTTPTTTTSPSTGSGLQAVTLGADALSLYDPYGNQTAKGDPADAADNDPKTEWFATSRNPRLMGLGLLVDLENAKGLRVIELATSTPGFRVEIYGAKTEQPADILDERWIHIRDRSKVDLAGKKDRNVAGDGKERIVLGGGKTKYRYYVLWLTTPPTAGGPTVKLSELTLFS